VWLPIDSKLPQEDYIRIQDAADSGDHEAEVRACDALCRAVTLAAQDIHTKYVKPPHTTDFGIMFLATEGLYAEVVRRPALVDDLQHRYRIVVAGPTTLAALLSSLRMGFQTLAIEQQAVEVWRVLGAVKTEFAKFGGVLEKVKRQLDTASRTIDETGRRTRAMQRKLRSVEELTEVESSQVLELAAADEGEAIGDGDGEFGIEDGAQAALAEAADPEPVDAEADDGIEAGQIGSGVDSEEGPPLG
jgi:DNA recombination protein RmuC